MDLDANISARLAICAIARSPLQKLGRWFFKSVEYSGHGVFWLLFSCFLYYSTSSQGAKFVILELFIGLIVDLVIQAILKIIFRRQRPVYNTDDMGWTVKTFDSFSFPSGHATRFGFLVIFVRFYFHELLERAVINTWTLFIVFSRLALGRHFLSDVICGLFIGYLEFLLVHEYAGYFIRPLQ